MRITELSITQLRALERVEFRFQPGFNLIVGVNGVGKSTALDAIRILMSRILGSVSESKAKALTFESDDIKVGSPFLDVSITVAFGDGNFQIGRRQWLERIAKDDPDNLKQQRREILETERLRERARTLLRELETPLDVDDTDTLFPDLKSLRKAVGASASAPLCIFYATNRSVLAHGVASKSKAAGGRSGAYAEALLPRSWEIRQFAAWMRVQEGLVAELPIAARHLETLSKAAEKFLPGYGNLRPNEDASRLLIDHGKSCLSVDQLSDGERGVLAMVLDLARRLSQANPSVDDPLTQAEAIVLIDELDLHLHPGWQRQIVTKLTSTFPRCQFIASTHSPQVIGEVEHDRVQIIVDGKVHSPGRSFGLDSAQVLGEVMDSPVRTAKVAELLASITTEVGRQRYEEARTGLSRLALLVKSENHPEVIRIRTLLDFMEGEA